nr:MAG TPA: U3 small nucleolar ribonucleoprotein [Herelleviridae sp.]DAO46524.1 MAG TPA: U3 small nucleolar ribonucleoprotein [Caudoviricetes sp.]DAQ36815.1 MAG TPA: U3 small nucleolar ribonucleoprotein [Caudoviricetes sp.]DAT46852.1 MAG TPA: U3 small nucleolar ribonucleoprotein [Caudoviricetes sp.]DAW64860.1 MAG TPA: U3 small nucleolar ribonucleoprotein [Caudoviricetes sp.]
MPVFEQNTKNQRIHGRYSTNRLSNWHFHVRK